MQKKKIIINKSPGFLMSLEALLAATFFSMVCALSLNLVWNGFAKIQEANVYLENVTFLANKIYEIDFNTLKKESFIKKYATDSTEDLVEISILRPTQESSLKEVSMVVKKIEFLKKDVLPDSSTKLVCFFPYSLEDDVS